MLPNFFKYNMCHSYVNNQINHSTKNDPSEKVLLQYHNILRSIDQQTPYYLCNRLREMTRYYALKKYDANMVNTKLRQVTM